MKRIITTLSVLVCALTLVSGNALAAEKPAKKDCGCCKATVEAGKDCKEACCTKAAAAGKVCVKCHPVKKEVK